MTLSIDAMLAEVEAEAGSPESRMLAMQAVGSLGATFPGRATPTLVRLFGGADAREEAGARWKYECAMAIVAAAPDEPIARKAIDFLESYLVEQAKGEPLAFQWTIRPAIKSEHRDEIFRRVAAKLEGEEALTTRMIHFGLMAKYPGGSEEQLVAALRDPFSGVREHAARGLGNLESAAGKAAIAALERVVSDRNEDGAVAEEARRSLERIHTAKRGDDEQAPQAPKTAPRVGGDAHAANVLPANTPENTLENTPQNTLRHHVRQLARFAENDPDPPGPFGAAEHRTRPSEIDIVCRQLVALGEPGVEALRDAARRHGGTNVERAACRALSASPAGVLALLAMARVGPQEARAQAIAHLPLVEPYREAAARALVGYAWDDDPRARLAAARNIRDAAADFPLPDLALEAMLEIAAADRDVLKEAVSRGLRRDREKPDSHPSSVGRVETLTSGLMDSALRSLAVLGQRDRPRVVAALRPLLRRAESERHATLLNTLASMGDAAAAAEPELRVLRTRPGDRAMVLAAIARLGRGAERYHETLRALAHDPRSATRYAAAAALCQFPAGREEGASVLSAALARHEYIQPPVGVTTLPANWVEMARPHVADAARALAATGDGAAPLFDALVVSLRELWNSDAIRADSFYEQADALIAAVGNCPSRADDAIAALAEVAGFQRKPPSFDFLKEPLVVDPEVRRRDEEAAETARWRDDTRESVADRACAALGRFGPRAGKAAPQVARRLGRDSSARQTLRAIGPGAVPHIVAALGDERAENAAKTLAEFGEEAVSAVPALIDLARDRGMPPHARRAGINALGALGSPAAGAAPWLEAFANGSQDFRDRGTGFAESARQALSRVQAPEEPPAP